MNLVERLARFSALSNGQKIALMFALAFSVALVAGFWLASGAREYRPLYVNISDRDGGAVLAALESLGIPHRTEAEGVISVPAGQLHDARLRLAAQGLPKGNAAGFELLDSSRFGTSQFVEQVKYQRALEGELKRSIESVQAVKLARVHLALPRAAAFLREQQAPSASVLLTVNTGSSLAAAHVAGIVHLVASSVPGLALNRVAVIDSTGALLNAPNVDTHSTGNAAQLGFARQFEQDVAQRIEGLISPLSGPGNVRAQVSAEVGFGELERTNMPAAVESSTLRPDMPAQPSAPSTDVARTETQSNETAAAQASSGALQRLSVTVILNNKRPTGAESPVLRAWSAAELTQIDTLVRKAMGFNASRGDSLNIVTSAFAIPDPSVAAQLPWWKDSGVLALGRDIARYGTLFLLIIFLVVTLIRPLLREFARGSSHAATSPEVRGARQTQVDDPEPALPLQRDPRAVANVIKDWVRADE